MNVNNKNNKILKKKFLIFFDFPFIFHFSVFDFVSFFSILFKKISPLTFLSANWSAIVENFGGKNNLNHNWTSEEVHFFIGLFNKFVRYGEGDCCWDTLTNFYKKKWNWIQSTSLQICENHAHLLIPEISKMLVGCVFSFLHR